MKNVYEGSGNIFRS